MTWQETVGEERFHVPLWAAHEFFKHRIKNTVAGELRAEIRAFDSAVTRLYERFRVYCSDDLFGFENGGGRFLDEYRRTIQPIRAMLRLPANSEQIGKGVQQVSTYIDRRLLPGPLSEVIRDVDADERVRNRGVIPPSFKDAHKRGVRDPEGDGNDEATFGDNSFGDLVFWREVLRHASEVRSGSILVVTADRKNDWFENQHGDEGLTESIRRRVPKPRPVPMAHPLLVREAFDIGAGTLDLIDPIYCGVLLEAAGTGYLDFASAAIDTQLPKLAGKPTAARNWANRFGQTAQLMGSLSAAANSDAGGEQDGLSDERADQVVAEDLDINFLRASAPLSKEASKFLHAFAAGNVVQRAELLTSIDWATLEDWTQCDLASLGRTIMRAAEVGDPSATSFVSHLRDQAPELSARVREPLYFGCLGALYFDDVLDRRVPSGALVILAVLDLVSLPEVARATAAIGEALKGQPPLFIPGSEPGELAMEIVTQSSADNKSPADLLSIRLADKDLTTTLQTDEALRFSTILKLEPPTRDLKVGALLDVLARYHLLPRQVIRPNLDSDLVVRVAEYAGVELDV